MITLTISRNENNRITEYIVRGHDDSEICAAISCLSQTTAAALQEILKHRILIHSMDGYLCVRFIQFPTANTQLLLDTMVLGVEKISRRYPGMVHIIERKKEG